MLWVFIGGGIGALIRFMLGGVIHNLALTHKYHLPINTIIINITGSLAIGIVYVLLNRYANYDLKNQLYSFLITGILGGYTTFSAFSLETVKLIESQRPMLALSNVIISVTLSISCTWLGIILIKKFI